jgi:hypothetical protein
MDGESDHSRVQTVYWDWDIGTLAFDGSGFEPQHQWIRFYALDRFAKLVRREKNGTHWYRDRCHIATRYPSCITALLQSTAKPKNHTLKATRTPARRPPSGPISAIWLSIQVSTCIGARNLAEKPPASLISNTHALRHSSQDISPSMPPGTVCVRACVHLRTFGISTEIIARTYRDLISSHLISSHLISHLDT